MLACKARQVCDRDNQLEELAGKVASGDQQPEPVLVHQGLREAHLDG